jgi:hypothetical protein
MYASGSNKMLDDIFACKNVYIQLVVPELLPCNIF